MLLLSRERLSVCIPPAGLPSYCCAVLLCHLVCRSSLLCLRVFGRGRGSSSMEKEAVMLTRRLFRVLICGICGLQLLIELRLY